MIPKDLLTRLLTITVAIPLALSLLSNPSTARALLLGLAFASLHEFFSMAAFTGRRPPVHPVVSAVLAAVPLLLHQTAPPAGSMDGSPTPSLSALLSTDLLPTADPLSLLSFFLLSLLHLTAPLVPPGPLFPSHLLSTSLTLLFTSYLIVGFHNLVLIAEFSRANAVDFCAVVWIADTGALLFGRCLPTVPAPSFLRRASPKKTTTGYVGGALAALSSLYFLSPLLLSSPPPPSHFLLISSLAAAGDLAESLVKRTAGVKDSGAVFPGHGGALDRMDSMILLAPVYYGMYCR